MYLFEIVLTCTSFRFHSYKTGEMSQSGFAQLFEVVLLGEQLITSTMQYVTLVSHIAGNCLLQGLSQRT